MAATPCPRDASCWKQACIYTGHRDLPIFVELVATDDNDWVGKGEVIWACMSEDSTGDNFLPTRQRDREGMVYMVTFRAATEEDRQFWLRSGVRERMVASVLWAISKVQVIGSMKWWAAYYMTLTANVDTHMSGRQRQRLPAEFLEPSRKAKEQRCLTF